jgi:antitoxin ParD1/3/4
MVGSGRFLLKRQGEVLANFCQTRYCIDMSTMNISLPESLKSFVDEQVSGRGYGTSSEYVRELIRKDQDRLSLRKLLLDGASSAATEPADADYFTSLRDRARGLRSK